MKQAKVEADEEIKAFKAQLEKEVKEMAASVRPSPLHPPHSCKPA
jgi:hypothetical protein